jgi:hypothetical protein
MATRKYRVNLHPITTAIKNVSSKLKKIQPKVSPADKKRIKSELELFDKCSESIKASCDGTPIGRYRSHGVFFPPRPPHKKK